MDYHAAVEAGRGMRDAALRQSRTDKATAGSKAPQFQLGDLVLELPEHQWEQFEGDVELPSGSVRSYANTAKLWPVDKRVDGVSWTAHRELSRNAERFDILKPGHRSREAREKGGKKVADMRRLDALPLDEQAEYVVTVLVENKKLNEACRDLLADRKLAKRVERLINAAEDTRSHEYKAALSELNRARRTKHPEIAAFETIEKVRSLGEYLRAVQEVIEDGSISGVRVEEIKAAATAARERADALLEYLDGEHAHAPNFDVIDTDIAKVRTAIPADLIESTPRTSAGRQGRTVIDI